MAKLPSGRFPFINLSKALERAQAIFENDKSGKGLKVPVAFAAWGYSDKSSGGFQTIAALKGYGLLVDEGANDDRSIKLTPEARRYFQTEIDADKVTLRAEFAARPQLMAHLLEHWDTGTVEDPVARTYLKTAIGMNEQSARSALGIYKENLSHLGDKAVAKAWVQAFPSSVEMGDSNGGEDGVSFRGARVGDLIDWEVDGVLGNPEPMRVLGLSTDQAWVFVAETKSGLPMEQVIVREKGVTPPAAPPPNPFASDQEPEIKVAEGYRSETFDADEGTVTITWPSKLSPQSVEDMKDWLELLKRRIERRAGENLM